MYQFLKYQSRLLCGNALKLREYNTGLAARVTTQLSSENGSPTATIPIIKKPPNVIALKDERNHLYAGCILQRNPVTLRKLSEFEKAYEDYQVALMEEFTRGTFDIRTPHKVEMLRLGEVDADEEGAAARKATKATEHTEALINATDHTNAPEYVAAEGDLRSLRRHLDRKLYLAIRNEQGTWRFPSVHIPNGNLSLRERVDCYLKRLVGEDAEVYAVGEAPLAYHFESLPDRIAPPLGIKTFFMKSQLIGGAFALKKTLRVTDYAWLVKEEVKGMFPEDYFRSIQTILQY